MDGGYSKTITSRLFIKERGQNHSTSILVIGRFISAAASFLLSSGSFLQFVSRCHSFVGGRKIPLLALPLLRHLHMKIAAMIRRLQKSGPAVCRQLSPSIVGLRWRPIFSGKKCIEILGLSQNMENEISTYWPAK